MSARVLAFGALEPALWGVVWAPEGSGAARLAFGAEASAGLLSISVGAPDPEEAWSLEGDDVSLSVVPAAPSGRAGDAGGRLQSVDSLCTVAGHAVLAGIRTEVNAPGWRSSIEAELDPEDIDSFRHIAGWTRGVDGVGLVSLRPRKARGHEDDLVAATVLTPVEGPRVADPRLSTTYAASGAPRRTSLELWFEEPSDETGDGAAAQYPRRAAGEAVGTGIDWELAGFALHAELLSWHTRGEDGTGIYLVGRRS